MFLKDSSTPFATLIIHKDTSSQCKSIKDDSFTGIPLICSIDFDYWVWHTHSTHREKVAQWHVKCIRCTCQMSVFVFVYALCTLCTILRVHRCFMQSTHKWEPLAKWLFVHSQRIFRFCFVLFVSLKTRGEKLTHEQMLFN